MQFESLPNEILLDIFAYFDIIPLFHAFRGLNIRFETLIYNAYQEYHLDFQRISKQDFDIICQQYLSTIIDRIVSLYLPASDQTPDLPQLFFSRGFRLGQFIQLRSLTLYNINFENTDDILDEISHLKNLIYLNITYCDIPNRQGHESYFWNQLWALPKLKQIYLKPYTGFDTDFTKLTVISSTLENCSIKTVNKLSFNDMVYLFQYTTHLRILSVPIRCEKNDEIFSNVFISLTSLNLTYYGLAYELNKFFQNTPNLYRLTIEMQNCYLNGHEWKQILTTNLLKIKVFRFKMRISSFHADDGEERIDEVLNTFQNSFWLDEHRWFVRCDWDPNVSRIYPILYSLPYAFDRFTVINNGKSKWTSPDNRKDCWSFNRVQYLICKNLSKEYLLNLHPIHFPKLHQLSILSPINKQIWCAISTFNCLTSLHITLNGEYRSDLQILFDQAPHLYELHITGSGSHDLIVLSKLTSRSIRRLLFDVSDHDYYPYYFNDKDCTILTESSLGRQCEILSNIYVTSFTSVVNLVNTMNNLRALTIYSKLQLLPPSTDIFIQWARNQLPTKCFISSCSIHGDCATIVLWIG